MKGPTQRKYVRRKPARPRVAQRKPSPLAADSTMLLDWSALSIPPALTWNFSAHLPPPPFKSPLAAFTPVQLSFGKPAVLEINMKPIVEGFVEFVSTHPILSLTIAAAGILTIWAYNQPARPTYMLA